MKPLHELIEASDPKEWQCEDMGYDGWFIFRKKNPEDDLEYPLDDFVAIDRASYDRMKQIAVELAKACEFYSNEDTYKMQRIKEFINSNCWISEWPIQEDGGVIARDTDAKCREILEGEK